MIIGRIRPKTIIKSLTNLDLGDKMIKSIIQHTDPSRESSTNNTRKVALKLDSFNQYTDMGRNFL